MTKIVKQSIGIDVAQDEIVVSTARMFDDWSWELQGFRKFANTPKGFKDLLQWVTKNTDQEVDVRYVMEATGVYHERLAYFLDDQGCNISIVLPNKISNYFRTLDVKTVTDKTCSEAIARFGLERKLDNWKRPKTVYRRLRQLARERGQVIDQRTMVKNQLHAEKSEWEGNKSSLSRLNRTINFFDKQIKEIEAEMAALARSDEDAFRSIKLLQSIPGFGELTATTILAETNGFELIRNKRQLTSYAGLDVKEKQSGTSIKGKAKISKRGNKQLRKCLHMPALTAVQRNERYKAIYARIVSKHGVKMKAAVAIQRRLLELAYTLYKTGRPYDNTYLEGKTIKKGAILTDCPHRLA